MKMRNDYERDLRLHATDYAYETIYHKTPQNQQTRIHYASEAIPVKWYYHAGPRVAGIQLRGFIYAGSNGPAGVSAGYFARSDIGIQPLIDPRADIEIPAADAILPSVPHKAEFWRPENQYGRNDMMVLTAMQRGKFLQFLASDKTAKDIDDIGYVFLYFYGLERRLLIDAVYGHISDTEHLDVVNEVWRLDREFGKINKRFHEDASSLLMFEGTLAKRVLLSSESDAYWTIDDEIRHDKLSTYNQTKVKRLLAYQHILLSRKSMHGFKIELKDIAMYAVLNMLNRVFSSTTGYRMPDIENATLWDAVKITLRRIKRAGVCSAENIRQHHRDMARIHKPSLAETLQYVPSGSAIQGRTLPIAQQLGSNIDLQLPMEELNKIAISAFQDFTYLAFNINNMQKPTENALNSVSPDVILCTRHYRSEALHSCLSSQGKIAIIPAKTMQDAVLASFNYDCHQNKQLIKMIQAAYSKVLEAYGFVPILDENNEQLGIIKKPSIKIGDAIVAYSMPVLYDKTAGTPSVMRIEDAACLVSKDDIELAWCYGWYSAMNDNSIPLHQVQKSIPLYLMHLPEQSQKTDMHNMRNIIAIMLVAYATAGWQHAIDYKTYMPKKEMDECGFDAVQSMMFSVLKRLYGAMIPPEQMNLAEKVYRHFKKNVSFILYDYQKFVPEQNDTNEGLDESILQQMIDETASVQSMLSRHMDVDGKTAGDMDGKQNGKSGSNTSGNQVESSKRQIAEQAEEHIDKQSGNVDAEQPDEGKELSVREYQQYIVSCFGDNDEMPLDALIGKLEDFVLKHSGKTLTKAMVMSLIAKVNDDYQESNDDILVDIDGNDALLNI